MSEYKNGDTASWDASRVRRSQAAGGGSAGGQHRPPQKHRRKRRHINPVLYLLCVLVVSAILAGTGWLLASDLLAFSREIPSSQEITVEITADDDMGSIARSSRTRGSSSTSGSSGSSPASPAPRRTSASAPTP